MTFTPPAAGQPHYCCENCGLGPLDKFVVPTCATMWHCRWCDLFQKGQLSPVSAYDLPYHAIYEPYRKRKLRTALVRLNRIERLLDPAVGSPRILDVGCSLGTTVEAAESLGWDAHGADVSRQAADYCRDRGLRCVCTDEDQLPYPDETFDVVTAWHVIEHVPNVAQTLSQWRRVLKPGGLLVLETPDTRCLKVQLLGKHYRRYWKAEHIYAFTRSNFEPFVQRAGLQILRYPRLGRTGGLSPAMTAYALAYQSAKGMMRLTGMSKAFQVFCRRPGASAIQSRAA